MRPLKIAESKVCIRGPVLPICMSWMPSTPTPEGGTSPPRRLSTVGCGEVMADCLQMVNIYTPREPGAELSPPEEELWGGEVP